MAKRPNRRRGLLAARVSRLKARAVQALGLRDPALQSGEALPRPFLWFLLVFGAGMILISLIGDQGLIAYWHLKREATSLEAEVERLEDRRWALREEVRALRGDDAAIELLARRKLGLVKPEETVYQLPADW